MWVMLIVFAFCWHDTDTYRTVVYGHGAFELCLPSLGFCYQINLLRSLLSGRTPFLGRLWGEEAGGEGIGSLQHDAVLIL